jgi:hypothetical protein
VTAQWSKEKFAMGGKFSYPPRLSKWLGKMRFLAGSRDNKVDEALL